MEDLSGLLNQGDVFFINEEKFFLLSPFLAVRTECLGGMLSIDTSPFKYAITRQDAYRESLLKMCVDGWCLKLIRENAAGAGEKQPEQKPC